MRAPPLRRSLAELVRIPSVSGDEGAIADHVCERLEASGASVERDRDDNVTAFLGPERGRSIALCGHLDTVPAAAGWPHDPWAPRVSKGAMTGLGASDMKAGLAVMLDAPSWGAGRPVMLAFTVNEEGGDTEKRDGVEAFLERHRPDEAVVLEPTAVGERIHVGAGCQGNLSLAFTVEGRAAHSSRPELGDNAVYRALPLVEEVRRRAEALGPVTLHSGMEARPVMSVTMLRAGVRPNIIPDRAEVTVNRRVSPSEDMARVAAELASLGSCSTSRSHAPYLLPAGDPFLRRALEASRAALGYAEPFCFRGWVDAALFSEAGVPAVTIGPGTQGMGHGPGESCVLSNLERCRAVVRRLVG